MIATSINVSHYCEHEVSDLYVDMSFRLASKKYSMTDFSKFIGSQIEIVEVKKNEFALFVFTKDELK